MGGAMYKHWYFPLLHEEWMLSFPSDLVAGGEDEMGSP
jgi:hypothetical protein